MKKKWIDPDGQLAIFSLLCDDCPYADCLGAKNAELRSRERSRREDTRDQDRADRQPDHRDVGLATT
jgi:hypothetical protein